MSFGAVLTLDNKIISTK